MNTTTYKPESTTPDAFKIVDTLICGHQVYTKGSQGFAEHRNCRQCQSWAIGQTRSMTFGDIEEKGNYPLESCKGLWYNRQRGSLNIRLNIWLMFLAIIAIVGSMTLAELGSWAAIVAASLSGITVISVLLKPHVRRFFTRITVEIKKEPDSEYVHVIVRTSHYDEIAISVDEVKGVEEITESGDNIQPRVPWYLPWKDSKNVGGFRAIFPRRDEKANLLELKPPSGFQVYSEFKNEKGFFLQCINRQMQMRITILAKFVNKCVDLCVIIPCDENPIIKMMRKQHHWLFFKRWKESKAMAEKKKEPSLTKKKFEAILRRVTRPLKKEPAPKEA